MRFRLPVLFAVLFVSAVEPVRAQVEVRGVVVDAATGESLPAATVQVAGTYRGTITNAEGAFSLEVPELPATLVVRYIGYETRQARVEASAAPVRIGLKAAPVALGEVVVTGEDPAVRIMREVIERKKVWRARLETFAAEAYTRFTLANDTGIVSIAESLSDVYWRQGDGLREVVQAQRTTANLPIDDVLPAARAVANLYDDDVELAGYTLRGVTHPDALRHYDFELLGTRALDGRTVYDIGVAPKNRLKAAFVGRVAVLDEAFALLEVELEPSEAFLFPPPIQRFDVVYEQQFSDFGGAFWLPVDFRAQIDVEVAFPGLLRFPTFDVRQTSRLTNYAVGAPVPDSLFADEAGDEVLAADSSAAAADSLLGRSGVAVPLERAEAAAYAAIDSTMTLEEAFEPTGPLARAARIQAGGDDEGSDDGEGLLGLGVRLRPQLWANRAEGWHLGLEASRDVGPLRIRAGGAWASALDGERAWAWGSTVRFPTTRRLSAEVAYTTGIAPRYRSDVYPRLVPAAAFLLGADDYYDYFYRDQALTFLGGIRLPRLRSTVTFGLHGETHAAAFKESDLGLFREAGRRPVQPIPPGDLRAASVEVEVGDGGGGLGVVGGRHLRVRVERGTLSQLTRERTYTRYDGTLTYRIPTFFRRRLLPNALDLRLTAGTYGGDLIPQRFGIVDGRVGPFAPFGTLRTRAGRPYEGAQHVAGFWEHNFRSVPFEALGLYGLARRGYSVLVFGGHARTWGEGGCSCGFVAAGTDGWHHEVGAGLSGLFGLLRLDVALRLDAPGAQVTLGAARLF